MQQAHPRAALPGGSLALLTLARLELRRSLAGGRALLSLGILALVLVVDWSPGASLLSGSDPAASARGLLRQGAWTLTLCVLLPALVHRAAATAERWHGGEGDWLGARPTGKWTALVGSALGTLAAGAVLLLLSGSVIELQAGAGGRRGLARIGHQDLPATRLLRPWQAPLELDLGPLADRARAGDELRLRCSLTLAGVAFGEEEAGHSRRPSGPTATLVWRVARGAEARTVSVAIHARAWLAVEVPEGPAPLGNRLVNRGPGAVALLSPDSLELWRRGPREASASLRVVGHALLLLLFGLPLALGLGFWMNALTATLLCGAGLLWGFALQDLLEIPGSGLPGALGVLGQGRLPALPGASEVGVALGGALAGLALGRAGARSWRHAR